MFIRTINNKSERNDRDKCLGWPVTSYGPRRDEWNMGYSDLIKRDIK